MRGTIAAVLALISAVTEVAAAPGRADRPDDEFRLVFLEADATAPVRRSGYDGALVDVGRIVSGRCAARGCTSSVVRKRFRLRIDGRATASRFVRVRAFVQADLPGQRIRVDGRLVTTVPQLVGSAVPLGVAVAHTLEIEVSASEPSGAISQTILWLVEDAQ